MENNQIEMIHSKVDELSPEEAKAILAGIPAIRTAAEEYDWEAARKDPACKYAFNSAAEKFGYDCWKYLTDHGVVSTAKQEFLHI